MHDPTNLTPDAALRALAAHATKPFLQLVRHGTLEVEIYRPSKVDLQQPHTRDEIYVVISGSGWFHNGPLRHRFEPGQVLLVPAGVKHWFEDFTDDFAVWVFFYGPEGGEEKTAITG